MRCARPLARKRSSIARGWSRSSPITSPRNSAASSGRQRRRSTFDRGADAIRRDRERCARCDVARPFDAELADDVLPRDAHGAVRRELDALAVHTNEIAAAPRAHPQLTGAPTSEHLEALTVDLDDDPGGAHQRLRVVDQAHPAVERTEGVGRELFPGCLRREAPTRRTRARSPLATGHARTSRSTIEPRHEPGDEHRERDADHQRERPSSRPSPADSRRGRSPRRRRRTAAATAREPAGS